MQPRRLSVRVSGVAWIFLGAGVVAMAFGAMSGFGPLDRILMLLLLGVGSLVVSRLIRQRAQGHLADVADEQFLEQLRPTTALSEDVLLEERRHVAQVLDILPGKLGVDQPLDELSRRLDFLGSFSVALNDLRYEIEELHEDAGLEPPAVAETVGDLVTQLAQARRLSAPPSTSLGQVEREERRS